jgi:hypothetical protein
MKFATLGMLATQKNMVNSKALKTKKRLMRTKLTNLRMLTTQKKPQIKNIYDHEKIETNQKLASLKRSVTIKKMIN